MQGFHASTRGNAQKEELWGLGSGQQRGEPRSPASGRMPSTSGGVRPSFDVHVLAPPTRRLTRSRSSAGARNRRNPRGRAGDSALGNRRQAIAITVSCSSGLQWHSRLWHVPILTLPHATTPLWHAHRPRRCYSQPCSSQTTDTRALSHLVHRGQPCGCISMARTQQ